MTDKEIKKALKCCNAFTCKGCPLINEKGCFSKSRENALALINRQQAEIERLQSSVDRYSIQVANQREQIEKYDPIKETLCTLWETMLSIGVAKRKEKPTLEELAEAVDQIKVEAIKEFAERLKATFPDREDKRCTLDDCYTLDLIDSIAEEMVGVENA